VRLTFRRKKSTRKATARLLPSTLPGNRFVRWLSAQQQRAHSPAVRRSYISNLITGQFSIRNESPTQVDQL